MEQLIIFLGTKVSSPPLSYLFNDSLFARHHLAPCSNKSAKAVQIQTAKSLIGSILLSSPFNPRLASSPGPIIAANSQILGSLGFDSLTIIQIQILLLPAK